MFNIIINIIIVIIINIINIIINKFEKNYYYWKITINLIWRVKLKIFVVVVVMIFIIIKFFKKILLLIGLKTIRTLVRQV